MPKIINEPAFAPNAPETRVELQNALWGHGAYEVSGKIEGLLEDSFDQTSFPNWRHGDWIKYLPNEQGQRLKASAPYIEQLSVEHRESGHVGFSLQEEAIIKNIAAHVMDNVPLNEAVVLLGARAVVRTTRQKELVDSGCYEKINNIYSHREEELNPRGPITAEAQERLKLKEELHEAGKQYIKGAITKEQFAAQSINYVEAATPKVESGFKQFLQQFSDWMAKTFLGRVKEEGKEKESVKVKQPSMMERIKQTLSEWRSAKPAEQDKSSDKSADDDQNHRPS